MRKRQLIKYIKNDMHVFEKRKTIEWIRQSPENQKKFNIVKVKYITSNFQGIRSDKNKEAFFDRLLLSVKKRELKRFIYVSASVLILFFALVNRDRFFFLKHKVSLEQSIEVNENMELLSSVTMRGAKKEIMLPDDSKVTLNTDSELIYPEVFNDSLREVTLIGEAFFDVKSDVSKPFIVYANKIKIKVLGTSFNIKSYSDDKNIETTLVTGKVELIKDKETPIILAPSQKAVFHKVENTLEIEEVNSNDVIAWKTGKLIFNKTSLQEVVADLERKYNVKININSLKLLDYVYTGTFDNLSIDEVLNLLTISSPIKYSIKNEEITLE